MGVVSEKEKVGIYGKVIGGESWYDRLMLTFLSPNLLSDRSDKYNIP